MPREVPGQFLGLNLGLGGDLLSEGRFIRHDPEKLAAAIAGLALSRGWLDKQNG